MRPYMIQVTTHSAGDIHETNVNFFITVKDDPNYKGVGKELIVSLRTMNTSIAVLSVAADSVEAENNGGEAHRRKCFQLDFGGYWTYEDYIRKLSTLLDAKLQQNQWPIDIEDFGQEHVNHMCTVRGWEISEDDRNSLHALMDNKMRATKEVAATFSTVIGGDWNQSKQLISSHLTNIDLFNAALKRLPSL